MKSENIGNKIENSTQCFIVVRRKSKRYIPEEWKAGNIENEEYPKDLKIILAFKSRMIAMRWVKYWRDGEKLFDVLERKIF